MVRLPQGEQLVTRQPVMRLPRGEAGEGEGASPPLKLDLSLSQRENQVKEGEETRLLPDLDHPPSCNNSTEIPHARRECQAREGEGTCHLLNLDHPPSSSSTEITAPGRGKTQRENQVKEGEGTRHLLNLHHHPGSSSSQEISVHHPGGQLA